MQQAIISIGKGHSFHAQRYTKRLEYEFYLQPPTLSPAMPIAPVRPCSPRAPWSPLSPLSPLAPVVPVGPWGEGGGGGGEGVKEAHIGAFYNPGHTYTASETNLTSYKGTE